MFTSAHSTAHIDKYAVKISTFRHSLMEMWAMEFCEGGVEACKFLNHLFPEEQQGLAHILRREGTFFSIPMMIHDSMYLQQYGKFLEVDPIASKATNQKQESKFSNFLA